MNSYSSITKDIMINNPKFFKEMLDYMDDNVKRLKKQYKEFLKNNNDDEK